MVLRISVVNKTSIFKNDINNPKRSLRVCQNYKIFQQVLVPVNILLVDLPKTSFLKKGLTDPNFRCYNRPLKFQIKCPLHLAQRCNVYIKGFKGYQVCFPYCLQCLFSYLEI